MATTLDYVTVGGIKIPLIYEEDKRLPIASMQLVFKNGGSLNDGKHPGLANLSAKMMNEGTLTRGSIGFANALDSKAIHISANAGRETFVFELSSLKEQFGEGMALLGELLAGPNLTEESLKKVKAVTLGSLSRKENDYDYVAGNALKALLFEGTPLEHPQAGTLKSVEAIDLPAVRNFVASHLVLSRAIIVVGGDIELDKAKAAIVSALNSLPEGEKAVLPYYPVSKKVADEELKRTTEQAYVYFGAPFDMRVEDEAYYKARVAMFILGAGGFGSRMMEEIRVKRGLAYSAYSRISVNLSHSYFSGYLQTKIESRKEAVETVRSVIDEFLKKGVTQEELEQAKKFLLGSEPLRVETLSQRLARTFQEYYRGLELGSSVQELEKIRGLELEELNRFIAEHGEIARLSFAIVTE